MITANIHVYRPIPKSSTAPQPASDFLPTSKISVVFRVRIVVFRSFVTVPSYIEFHPRTTVGVTPWRIFLPRGPSCTAPGHYTFSTLLLWFVLLFCQADQRVRFRVSSGPELLPTPTTTMTSSPLTRRRHNARGSPKRSTCRTRPPTRAACTSLPRRRICSSSIISPLCVAASLASVPTRKRQCTVWKAKGPTSIEFVAESTGNRGECKHRVYSAIIS